MIAPLQRQWQPQWPDSGLEGQGRESPWEEFGGNFVLHGTGFEFCAQQEHFAATNPFVNEVEAEFDCPTWPMAQRSGQLNIAKTVKWMISVLNISERLPHQESIHNINLHDRLDLAQSMTHVERVSEIHAQS